MDYTASVWPCGMDLVICNAASSARISCLTLPFSWKERCSQHRMVLELPRDLRRRRDASTATCSAGLPVTPPKRLHQTRLFCVSCRVTVDG